MIDLCYIYSKPFSNSLCAEFTHLQAGSHTWTSCIAHPFYVIQTYSSSFKCCSYNSACTLRMSLCHLGGDKTFVTYPKNLFFIRKNSPFLYYTNSKCVCAAFNSY